MATNRLETRLGESSDRVWSFAGRTFDELRLELRVNGEPVDLELKPLEVLVYLLQRAGEVVSKRELLNAVWPDLNVVEGSLSTAVCKLRKALGDDDSNIIATVPRVGYRLAVEVYTDHSQPRPSVQPKLVLAVGNGVPGREHWRLLRTLDTSAGGEVWLAEHPKTHELRVFKFVSKLSRLRTLKREVTVFRFLSESLPDRRNLVQILEWNFETEPYFLESEFGGPNLAQWAEERGGLSYIPLPERLRVLTNIASAVAEVHVVGVLHKDLKPANVLLSRSPDGQDNIKIADFGSALLTEPSRLEALGITRLGMTQTATAESTSLSGTLLYLAPEVLSGKMATAQSDVYALGVMLYQMVIGEFRKPLSPGWEEDIADPLLREDIAAAVCGDPARRLRSTAELAERLGDLEARRGERNRRESEQQQQELAERKRREARVRRPWIAFACVLVLGLVANLYFLHGKRSQPPAPTQKSVAVLPFQNVGADRSFDYLSLPLADEVATTLSYARGLAVQPFLTTSQYTLPGVDLRKAGAEMKASSIIRGRFVGEGDQLHLTLEAIDVTSGRVLWADTLDAPARNMIELRDKIVARTQGVLAAALGGSAYTVTKGTRPTSNEAYDLYLRALSMPYDSGTNQPALAMLERSVTLDPNFAPAWLQLGRRRYVEVRYGKGGSDMEERYVSAEARAVALDPDYIPGIAIWTGVAVENGDETKAMQQAEDLVLRHPDSSDAHYILNYALRYAGLIDESSHQCDIAFQIDAHEITSGLRSCAIVPTLRGDHGLAERYLRTDPYSDFTKAFTLAGLLRAGKTEEALQLGAPHIQQWPSYDMLIACAEHKQPDEVTQIAAKIRVSPDPEANYLDAANLAYCGENDKALSLLSKAVEGHYCSYPVMDADPFFAGLRGTAEYEKLREAGIACQQAFSAEWQRIQRQSSP